MYKFRIEPLDENGILDKQFLGSSEYKNEIALLKKYLKIEGFESVEKEFSIMFRDRTWYVKPPTSYL